MKYHNTTPSNGFSESYTHTIYYKSDAFRDLEADIPLIRRTGNSNEDQAYWKDCWKGISYVAKNWLDTSKDPTARAIILHHVGEGASETSTGNGFWRSWN